MIEIASNSALIRIYVVTGVVECTFFDDPLLTYRVATRNVMVRMLACLREPGCLVRGGSRDVAGEVRRRRRARQEHVTWRNHDAVVDEPGDGTDQSAEEEFPRVNPAAVARLELPFTSCRV